MIATARIKQLFDRYLDLVRLEVEEFGVKATEVRHLIGRLGEFYCALKVDGSLASRANQPGFDIVCPSGRRISVKTTAQTSGFVAIAKSTQALADDLMVVRYHDGALSTIYFGPLSAATDVARFYQPTNAYELDISRAEKLANARFEESKELLASLEGGFVHTATRNGEYLVLVNQTAALDLLDAEDRDGIEPVVEYSFPTLAARNEYMHSRGWSSAV
ncbi:hypothetical protein K7B09_12830 [Thermomonas sp. RSS23]|uniref:DUF6998 domain-containing protein n=1 Tax=Thermomonas beijingensis TaxID=2872701 RepID=A0ABS7TH71_9GAMM|nr:hypothetical protein [Thermomonas beijingensis]MBZ4187206.1 hypothetical protein [Thermomonas beijingensis]